MSNRHEVEGRTIHPRALKELGLEVCIAALGVARDLRSGVIPRTEYNQSIFCGTICCIAGHIALRIGEDQKKFASRFIGIDGSIRGGFNHLFSGIHPSDPILAADAILRKIYDGSKTPWTPS